MAYKLILNMHNIIIYSIQNKTADMARIFAFSDENIFEEYVRQLMSKRLKSVSE